MSDNKPVTMRDIARRAGVSQPTVSQALRNHSRISLETRKKVHSIAMKMGYKLDPKIQELMGYLRKSEKESYFGTIGLLLGFNETWGTEEWPHYAYLEGAERRAQELGYKSIRFFIRKDGMNDKRLSQILKARGIQGLVVFPFVKQGEPLDLEWESFSTVLIGFNLEKPALHRVMSDHFGSMRLAIDELVAKGYKRIGYAIDSTIERRLRYSWRSAFLLYQDSIKPENRIPHFSFEVPPGGKNSQPDDDELRKWYEENEPEVILGLSHSPLITLRKIGVRVPEQVEYVTLDWKRVYSSELPGIDQHGDEIGAASIEKTVAMLQRNETGIPRSPQSTSIKGIWHHQEGY